MDTHNTASLGFPASLENMIKLQKGHDPNKVICRAYQDSHSPGIFYGKDPLQFSFPLLLLEVSMVIVITRIVRFALKPLKQPRIVSEIIVSFFFFFLIFLVVK